MKFIDCSTKKYPNGFAMVDDEDFDHLNQWKWCLHKSAEFSPIYAIRKQKICEASPGSVIWMHREVLKTDKNLMTDHVDGDGLNNQKRNLRPCRQFENQANRRKNRNKTSPYKGVCLSKHGKKYVATIRKNGKTIYLGYFAMERDAAIAYNSAAKTHFGEFARINVIQM